MGTKKARHHTGLPQHITGFEPLDRFLEDLDDVVPENGHYRAMCPNHDGSRRALTAMIAGEPGDRKVVVHCHAGCKTEDILEHLGLGMPDLFEREIVGAKANKRKNWGTVEATYDYVDLAGDLVFQVVRYRDPKDFRQRRPDEGGDGWIWSVKDIKPLPLYRLPEVVGAIAKKETVLVCEGEKDVDRAREELGVVATTAPEGADKWDPSHTAMLRGAHVVLIPDQDEPGHKHMNAVARELLPVAKSVKLLELPGLSEGGDLSDWLDAGGTKEVFDSFTPRPLRGDEVNESQDPYFGAVRFVDVEDPGPTPYAVEDYFPEGHPSSVFGYGGVAKSIVGDLVAVSVAGRRKEVLGKRIFKPGNALILDFELGIKETKRRVRRICEGLGISEPDGLFYMSGVGEEVEDVFERTAKLCKAERITHVVLDSIGFAMDGEAEKSNHVNAFHRRYIDRFRRAEITVLMVDHQGKLQSGESYQQKGAFGSAYKSFRSRSMLQFQAMDHGPDAQGNSTLTVRMRHTKNNFGPSANPKDLKITFVGNDEIRFDVVEVDEDEQAAEETVSTPNRIKRALGSGPKNVEELVTQTGLSKGTLQNHLPGMQRRGEIVVVGTEGRSKIYGLPEEDPKSKKDSRGPSSSRESGDEIHDESRNESQSVGPVPERATEEDLPPNLDSSTSSPYKGSGVDESRLEDRKPKKEKKKKATRPPSLLALARANKELSTSFNIVYRKRDVARVVSWLRTVSEVSVDSETYGEDTRKEERERLALSFVKGKVRLVQLSADGTTYLIDARLLPASAVASILEELKGKALYLHNAIFDLPRFKKHFGVDLTNEDVRDTMVLSRLARTGEAGTNEKGEVVQFGHGLREALVRECGVEIPKETEHRWERHFLEEDLRYAVDDVEHLPELYRKLRGVIEERGLEEGLRLFKRVYPAYMRMQYRGLPLDKGRLERLREGYQRKSDEAFAKIEEHKPKHPEGGEWSWRNNQPIKKENPAEGPGRNGARRALAEAGIKLSNLKKATRESYLRKHPGEAPLLEALHQYLLYQDLLTDSAGWLKYSYKDGRLYPNVKPFSQVTGRSAYSNPGIQNTPKERDRELEISLRDCIKAPRGSRVVKADYAAQELRILAQEVARETGDEKLVEFFARGLDPHAEVGGNIYATVRGKPFEEASEEEYKSYRKLGKRANYGLSYGQGLERYQQSIFEDTFESVSLKQVEVERDIYRKTWPGVHDWQQSFGARDGRDEDDWYTLSPVGRRRYVARKWNERQKKHVPNYCDRLNGPIQAGGCDMLYTALELLLEDKEAGLFPEVEVLLTTHDEIALEAPTKASKKATTWLAKKMVEAARKYLRSELAKGGKGGCVEAGVGPSWGGA
jgi:DNA polymerase I-like protein with 3'-5' exonuclease and polymerase domains